MQTNQQKVLKTELENYRHVGKNTPERNQQLKQLVLSIEDEDIRKVSYLRYMDDRTVPYIMCEVNFSYEYIYKLLRKGLRLMAERELN